MIRGSGRTTEQILTAPYKAVYVWCNGHPDYVRRLCRDLGRSDLRVVGPDYIVDRRYYGQNTPCVFDHAFFEHATGQVWNAWHEYTFWERSRPWNVVFLEFVFIDYVL